MKSSTAVSKTSSEGLSSKLGKDIIKSFRNFSSPFNLGLDKENLFSSILGIPEINADAEFKTLFGLVVVIPPGEIWELFDLDWLPEEDLTLVFDDCFFLRSTGSDLDLGKPEWIISCSISSSSLLSFSLPVRFPFPFPVAVVLEAADEDSDLPET